ncbi:OppA family ABC transporter substrate-binding lipoprotein [Mycoplasmopsis gallopavonis]|uniref:Lipoprotein n=1 Tax=Mycoplasmopsis gallopavonis TaxID=76629 RepID=A0A449B0C4_9BACT|nr:hypothetical protein [Mycoplasmopsis gallopavonis]RIV16551.1 hypothetical protein D1113_01935 [Mycoplasmopsis gallopavonis]VEU73222.1 Uncharacterised protein [Mycoplasmopsis gallopavonis]
MKKRWLLLSSLLATATPAIALSAACGTGTKQTTPTNPGKGGDTSLSKERQEDLNFINSVINAPVDADLSKLAKQGYYRTLINLVYQAEDFEYDHSLASGGKLGRIEDLAQGGLLSLESSGETIFRVVKTTNDDGTEVSEKQILRPSVEKMKFEYADAILITLPDGTVKTYDSEEAEVTPEPDINGRFYSNTVVNATSQNPRSINSATFVEDLNKASKVEFRIRKNAYWVNQNGEKTKYQVTANDFWAGLARTYLSGVSNRRRLGGTADLDAETRKLLIQATDFADDKEFNNEYLFNLFNFQIGNVENREAWVRTDAEQNSYFVWNRLDQSQSTNFYEILTKIFADYDFQPVPYEYLVENKDQPIVRTKKQDIDTTTLVNKIKQEATGLAKELGVYWYGTQIDNTLYSGKYYPLGYNTETYVLSMKLNPNYFDQAYVQNKYVVKQFQRRYQVATVEETQFATEQWNQYKSGDNATVPFSTLTTAQKAEVEGNTQKFGLTYAKSENKTTYTQRLTYTMTPDVSYDSATWPNYNFSDLLSRLIYGQAREGIFNQKTSVLNYISGDSLEFRTILGAAINWKEVSSIQKPNADVLPWLVPVAPDSEINNNVNDHSAPNTPRSSYELLNTLFAVDGQTGQRIDLGNGLGTEISPSETNARTKNSADQIKSEAFDTLSEKFTALLDRFYASTNTPATTKLEFPIFYRFVNVQDTVKKSFEKVVETWNALDKKGRFHATFAKAATDAQWREYWFGNRFQSTIGWHYDYNGIGSGLDGMSATAQVIPMLGVLAYNDEARAKLAISFPRTASAAEAYKKFVEKEGVTKFSIPVSQWGELTNEQYARLSDILGTQKVVNGQTVKLTAEEIAQTQPESFYLLSAKFWLRYTNGEFGAITKKEILELTNELAQISGVHIDALTGILKDSFVPVIGNPSYVSPSVSDNNLDRSNIRIKKQVIGS